MDIGHWRIAYIGNIAYSVLIQHGLRTGGRRESANSIAQRYHLCRRRGQSIANIREHPAGFHLKPGEYLYSLEDWNTPRDILVTWYGIAATQGRVFGSRSKLYGSV